MAPAGVDSYFKQQEMRASYFIDEAVTLAKTQGIKVRSELLRADKSIIEEIIEISIREKIDLIVIGTRGLGGFRKLLLGSVSSGVVTHAKCKVLVVR